MQSPLPFQAIPAAKDAKYFFNDKGPRTEATTRHPQCFLFWNECDTRRKHLYTAFALSTL